MCKHFPDSVSQIQLCSWTSAFRHPERVLRSTWTTDTCAYCLISNALHSSGVEGAVMLMGMEPGSLIVASCLLSQILAFLSCANLSLCSLLQHIMGSVDFLREKGPCDFSFHIAHFLPTVGNTLLLPRSQRMLTSTFTESTVGFSKSPSSFDFNSSDVNIEDFSRGYLANFKLLLPFWDIKESFSCP